MTAGCLECEFKDSILDRLINDADAKIAQVADEAEQFNAWREICEAWNLVRHFLGADVRDNSNFIDEWARHIHRLVAVLIKHGHDGYLDEIPLPDDPDDRLAAEFARMIFVQSRQLDASDVATLLKRGDNEMSDDIRCRANDWLRRTLMEHVANRILRKVSDRKREEAKNSGRKPAPLENADSLPKSTVVGAQAIPKSLFRRKGRHWAVRFGDGPEFTLSLTVGAKYLYILLANSGEPIPAVDLVHRCCKNPERFSVGNSGGNADREKLSDLHKRLRELDAEMETAKDDCDISQQDQIQEEIDCIRKEICRDTKLGGVLRKETGDCEKMRKSVSIAIKRAIKAISDYDPALERHLRQFLQLGARPCYLPNVETSWETSEDSI